MITKEQLLKALAMSDSKSADDIFPPHPPTCGSVRSLTTGDSRTSKEEPHYFDDPDFEEFTDDEYRLWKGKGDAYSMGIDRLYNFTSIAEKLGLTPMQIWSVYFMKHVYAVLNYARTGKEDIEAVESRLADICVYGKLGRLLVRRGKANG